MNKNKSRDNKKSPLLDLYIQKQNQETNFDKVGEEEIAKAIRSLLIKDEMTTQELN